MLSSKCRFAIKAMCHLARRPAETCKAGTIAAAEHIPLKFLTVILCELTGHGLIRSYRGKRGGYALTGPPEKTSFADVVCAIDGPLLITPCLGDAERTCSGCADKAGCALRQLLLPIQAEVAVFLARVTIADALGADDDGSTALPSTGWIDRLRDRPLTESRAPA